MKYSNNQTSAFEVSTVTLFVSQFDLSPLLIGLVFTIAPALYGISAPLFGYLSDTKVGFSYISKVSISVYKNIYARCAAYFPQSQDETFRINEMCIFHKQYQHQIWFISVCLKYNSNEKIMLF